MSNQAQRDVISRSWRRAQMSGLTPSAPVADPRIVEIDRRSRLVTAASPVLDSLEQEIRGTGFSLILADESAFLVDIRVGTREMWPALDTIGAAPGSRFLEETTGTNAIATVFELQHGLSVHSDEHFIEPFKQFSCYGHPILHPVTRRIVGVLDITCLAKDGNPLLAPFVRRAVQGIEDQLLARSAAADQRLLAEFHTLAQARRGQSVVALGNDLFMANETAIDLLDTRDHAVLRDLVVDTPSGRTTERELELTTGTRVNASVQTLPGGDRALITLEPVERRVEQLRPARPRSGSVLIHGESGTGRTRALLDLVRDEQVTVLDASTLPESGEKAWLARVDEAVARGEAVSIEAIDLLPQALARRLVPVLRNSPAPVYLTSAPLTSLEGDVAALARQCSDRVELLALRNRRAEIPVLVQTILTTLGARRELRFTPGALEALASQPWPGNFAELSTVVQGVMERRQVGDVTVHDLPPTYQARARSRTLSMIEQAEHDAVLAALRACNWEKKAAAARLGISRTTLYRAIRTLGIIDQKGRGPAPRRA